MADTRNYYEILGVPRDATAEDIRRAYFEAARRLHPDKNVAPGETEFFLDVQGAYEVLSNPQRRATYDASLPPQKTSPIPIKQKVLFSRKSLFNLEEAQLIYVLLQYSPNMNVEAPPSPPLNLCLVLDRSTSMQGQNMDMVKTTAIQVMRKLRPEDTFSVVAFSDRAEVVIPASHNLDLPKLEARIQMLQPSGGTEMSPALKASYNEIIRNFNRSQVNHIILITDGRTYGDEKQCLDLAQKASENGIGISGVGIGHEWNDTFVDELVSRTGGSSMYVARPQDIQRVLINKFNQLSKIYCEETRLEFKAKEGIELRYAFRLQPEAGLLPLQSPILLGPIPTDRSLKVLMEFSVKTASYLQQSNQQKNVILLQGGLTVSLPGRSDSIPPFSVSLSRPISDESVANPPPAEIMDALSRLTLYRLQEQARLEVNAGEYDRASEHLQKLATHLLAQGQRGLARTVLLEAEQLNKKKSLSQEGDKEIKYGTRALLMSGEEKD